MPLIAGAGAKEHSANVAEMVRAFKKSGRIGNSKPGSMRKALAQANAAAYRKQAESRRTVAHG
jgi:phage I-like protein